MIIAGQGKPVFYLNGRKLRDSNDLHELNAADIRSIRIDYRPHARHEASAIHITTRRTRQDGLSLSAQTACGQSENTDITTQLHASYHLNQLDLFTHLSASFQNEDSYTCMEQDIREDTITHLSLQSHLSDRHQTVRSVLGFSYSHDSVNSSGMRLALNVDLPSDGQESYEGSAHFLQPWDTPLRETKNPLHSPRNSSFSTTHIASVSWEMCNAKPISIGCERQNRKIDSTLGVSGTIIRSITNFLPVAYME